MPRASLSVIQPGDPAVASDLQKLLRGQVRFGRHDRALYSTDASLYQVEPIGVVVPADIDDLIAVVRFCAERKIPMLPRGGGTSLAGQCVNRAVLIDTAPALRNLLSIDVQTRTCIAEPGIPIDELNRLLTEAKTGLFFAADPATVAQATVGGIIGNNAAGSRSIRYGRTSENLEAIDILLPSGERTWIGPGAGRSSPVALRLAQGVAEICRRHADDIRRRFPKTVRRNAGYGLDLIVQQLDRGVAVEDLDLAGMMCGSEGTLALTLGAKLKLNPVPLARGLAVVTFASLEDAIDRVVPIVATKATAVELLDEVVLEAARGNTVARKYVDLLPQLPGQPEPKAVLYVEYSAEHSRDEIGAGFEKLKALCPAAAIELHTDAASMGAAWALRRAAEPLLHGIAADKKPQTFVEDNAVPIENLARFVSEFKKIVTKHGTRASYWAHASVGVLHVRPLVDVHDPADRARILAISQEVADLARDCGGVMSGEHGDGRIRGPLLEQFFGPDLMSAFRELKQLFDPENLLNPDNIVKPGPVGSIMENLRVMPEKNREVHVPEVDTYFTYEDGHGFHGSVEMCNGAGLCRRMSPGVMCPSYRATLDERHATRGRGNALRLAITGQFDADGVSGKPKWDDEETIKTLDLCLSCKACKSECPSNVDIARLKAEYTAQRYKEKGAPLSSKVFGHVRTLNQLGSIAPGLSNWVNSLPPVRAVMNKALGLAKKRSIPAFAPSLFKWFERRRSVHMHNRPVVVLYADCFVTYNEPHIGRAAVKVLEACGYEVRLPNVGCCGRAAMSTGLLPDAIVMADRTLDVLTRELADPAVQAIVVCEPSCLSAIKDDWLHLKLKTSLEARTKVAAASWLVEDFVDSAWDKHPVKPAFKTGAPPVILHGHCHQKAMSSDATSARPLRRVTGDPKSVSALPSGCCGMAGSFGYLEHRYDVSMKIGELSVFPPVRNAPETAVICAPGTSCRHQIHDGTGRKAVHPIEFMADQLA